MKFQSTLLHASLAVSGAFATDKLTPDAVEADIREDQCVLMFRSVTSPADI